MSLIDIPYKAGIFTEDTDRGVGKLLYWKDCDHVRFFNGHPQKFGGWLKALQTQFRGKARSTIDWVTTRQEYLIAIGTHKKLYIFSGGKLFDITPIRASGTLTDPFTVSNGSTVITVTDTVHGLTAGDFVHFSGADPVGGILIDGEYEVSAVNTADEYEVIHSTTAGLNILTYSEEFDNVIWTKTGAASAVTADAINAPNGTATADKLIENSAINNYFELRQVFTAADNAIVNFSCYVKADEREFIRIAVDTKGGTFPQAIFNLLTGAVVYSAGGVLSATGTAPDANGWCRCSIVVNVLSGGSTLRAAMRTQLSASPSTHIGVIGYGVYIWGAQVTLGADLQTYALAEATASPATGGGSVDFEYEIPLGNEYEISGLGWGAGGWGEDTWGTARDDSGLLLRARIWSLAIWGEDLLASPYDGPIYVWDSSAGTGTRATLISQAPSTNKAIFVSQDARQVLALGAHDGTVSDPQLVRWCSQEDYTDWTPTLANTAGDKRLELGTEIYTGIATRTETLLFTNTAMYSMSYVGSPDVYGFQPLGLNGGLAGPRAVNTFNGVTYWMSAGGFYRYDGTITELPCAVYEKVFKNINRNLLRLIQCAVITDFSEVLWLYASEESPELNRYVIFNIVDASWYYGSLNRTTFAGSLQNTMRVYGCGADGYLYNHELGVNDNIEPMESYLYSGDIEIDSGGEQLMRIGKFIADMMRISGSIQITFSGKKYPQDTEVQESGPHEITSATDFINPRLRCRQMSFQIDNNELGSDWRIGTVRIDAKPDGKR